MDEIPDVNEFLERLREGDSLMARTVFRRYARRLIELAEAHLSARLRTKEGPEDVVQSVFRSFFMRIGTSDWHFADWNGLWELLAVLTVRKCADRATFYSAARRNRDREDGDASTEAITKDPSPDEVAELCDLLSALLDSFEPRGKSILELVMQGHTAGEVAEKMACSERTVYRTLERARARLTELSPGPST